MIRLVVRTVVLLIANAIGLIVASYLLDGVDLNASGFFIALIVFTVVSALLTPFFASQIRRHGSTSALGGVALIATLASLIITTIVTDGLSISGAGDWIAAMVIVWLAALVAAFIVPYFGLKKYLDERR